MISKRELVLGGMLPALVRSVLTRAVVVLIRSIMRAGPAAGEGMHIQPSHSVGWVCCAGVD